MVLLFGVGLLSDLIVSDFKQLFSVLTPALERRYSNQFNTTDATADFYFSVNPSLMKWKLMLRSNRFQTASISFNLHHFRGRISCLNAQSHLLGKVSNQLISTSISFILQLYRQVKMLLNVSNGEEQWWRGRKSAVWTLRAIYWAKFPINWYQLQSASFFNFIVRFKYC